MLKRLWPHPYIIVQSINKLLIATTISNFEVKAITLPRIHRISNLRYIKRELAPREYLGGEAVGNLQGVGAVAVAGEGAGQFICEALDFQAGLGCYVVVEDLEIFRNSDEKSAAFSNRKGASIGFELEDIIYPSLHASHQDFQL